MCMFFLASIKGLECETWGHVLVEGFLFLLHHTDIVTHMCQKDYSSHLVIMKEARTQGTH